MNSEVTASKNRNAERFEISAGHGSQITVRTRIVECVLTAFNSEARTALQITEWHTVSCACGFDSRLPRQVLRDSEVKSRHLGFTFIRARNQRDRGRHNATRIKAGTNLLKPDQALQEKSCSHQQDQRQSNFAHDHKRAYALAPFADGTRASAFFQRSEALGAGNRPGWSQTEQKR